MSSNARATSPISSRRVLAIRVAKSPLRIRSVACWIARIGARSRARTAPTRAARARASTAPASARFSREWRSASRSAARSAATRSIEPRQRCDDARELLARLRAPGTRAARRTGRTSARRAAASTASTATRRPSGPVFERSSVDRDEVGLARVGREPAFRRGDCGREQPGVARRCDRAAALVDEGDQASALAPLEVARVVGERGRVLDLEIGAQLRCAGDGAVALRERGLVGRDELARGARGAVEPRRGRAREVARERAVLERERDRARERDQTRERQQQPEPDRPPEATAPCAVARAFAHARSTPSPPRSFRRDYLLFVRARRRLELSSEAHFSAEKSRAVAFRDPIGPPDRRSVHSSDKL